MFFDRLDVSIGRGPLYLQGGWTCPARNPITRSKSMKNPSCTRTLPGPVRPVGPTGQTGRSLPDRSQYLDRSDRSVRPIGANFGCQHTYGVRHSVPKSLEFHCTSEQVVCKCAFCQEMPAPQTVEHTPIVWHLVFVSRKII